MEEYELGSTLPGIRSDTDGLKIWLSALYSASILHTLKINLKKRKNCQIQEDKHANIAGK